MTCFATTARHREPSEPQFGAQLARTVPVSVHHRRQQSSQISKEGWKAALVLKPPGGENFRQPLRMFEKQA